MTCQTQSAKKPNLTKDKVHINYLLALNHWLPQCWSHYTRRSKGVCVSAGGTGSDLDLNRCSSITICFHSSLTGFILLEAEGTNWNLKCGLSKRFCMLRLLQLALWVIELVGSWFFLWVCEWRWYSLNQTWLVSVIACNVLLNYQKYFNEY